MSAREAVAARDTVAIDAHAPRETVLRIAAAKAALPWGEAVARGILCNALVCLAIWLAMADAA